ncbi:hypothetical protein pneo_cds_546 [Pandoravirus neocaledonia]|uniref:Uncharacterized protein n=1 Tax=Pandoravirus neocaledonia TaxID=2107708 RepID=A0A2U7UCJ2_9VIRU|nr:hypothetical protein pneo_cds_546 [Pandoravirus neocaledonia]AVK76153.1 hypothetical protein pneo_cds_546 [Pandoravirus neocaledonia]
MMLTSRANAAAGAGTNAGDGMAGACPQPLGASVPPAFVFRIVGADDSTALCVDARQLDHLDKLGGSRTLRDAIEYAVLDALPAGAAIAENPAVAAAVSDAVDLNASRFKARWRQIDPAHGVEPPPGVEGILSAALRPRLYVPPGLPAAAIEGVWARDPAGQRLRYAVASSEADGGVARAMGIAGHATVLPRDLLAQWSDAFLPDGAPSDKRLSIVTYRDPAGSRVPRHALVTRVRTAVGGVNNDDAGATGERVYTSVSGAQMRLPRDAVLDETPLQPFVGLALHSVDPALTNVVYGYAVPGDATMPTTDALVPYDVLWRLWEGRSDAPPTDIALPRPLASAAAQIDAHPDIGRGDVIAAPSVFAPVAAIVVAPAAQDAADALDAYAASVAADTAAGAVPAPVQRALDGMPMVADGQMIVVPPDMWAPVRVAHPVALVVRRLFGHVRRDDASDVYQVERVPVAVVHTAPYEISVEPLDIGAPADSYDALRSYYAAGPGGQRRQESPVGDAAEARAIEAAIRAQEALGGAASAGPSLDVLMASRQAPTARERAHWSQFMRRVARDAGGLVPQASAAVENRGKEEEEGPGRMAGLHIEPLPGAAGPHRVLRYDTARDVWHDVSLARPALPSLSDDDVEALLLAPPTIPGAARAPVSIFYLVGPEGTPVSPADLTRSVTFAPEALAGAERQEGRRRAEAQRAQAESRAQARAANARAIAEASEAGRPPQLRLPGGSVLGRRKQPPAPIPAPSTAAAAAQPVGLALVATTGAPTLPQLPTELARQSRASLTNLLASDVPDTVAQLMGVPPGRVRDILANGAWTAVVGGRDADAERLASVPAQAQNPGGPSVLDVVDNAVYEFTGVGPEIVGQVVDRTARDPRWRPETDGPVTPRRVLGVIAAGFDPVVRARAADPDSNASAVILNQVYFALARQARGT